MANVDFTKYLAMMNRMDLIAFYESRAGTTTLQNIAGLADPHVGVSGDNIVVPDWTDKIMALAALAQTATSGAINGVQVSSPSRLMELDIGEYHSLATAAPLPTAATPVVDLRYNPYQLHSGENLQAFSSNSGTNTEDALLLAFLTKEAPVAPIPSGWPIETVKCTNGSTLVANAWTNGALTFRKGLREGIWAVVGMQYYSTNAQAARLVFGNQGARPGCMGYVAVSTAPIQESFFRRGNLGVWGVFSHLNPPTVDFLADGADTAQTVFLDLVNLSELGL